MRSYLRSLAARFLRRSRTGEELDEELRSHIEHRAADLERSGLERAQAERQARIEFGSQERFKEECRNELGGNFIDALVQDARFSFRTLRRSPGFFLVAVLTLALGIGATVAAFSVVNVVLLRPFGYSEPDRLLWIYSQRPDNPRTNFSVPEYCDYRDQNTSFEGLAAVASFNPSLSDSGRAERVQGVRMTANAFALFGVPPILGRTLVAADDRSGAPAVVVISHSLWSRRYGKDPGVIGRSVNLNGETREIVGVLPGNFALPNLDSDIVVPLQPDSDPRRNARNSVNFLRMVGRLKATVTLQQAHAELDSIRQNLHRQFPDFYTGKIGITMVRLTEEIVTNIRAVLITIFCAAGAVLLIGCINIAGISLARAAARQRELAVRTALGASRGQLTRLLLVESFILGLIGGSLGLVLEIWGQSALLRLVPTDLPRIESFSIDWQVFAFTSLLVLLATLVCGLAPAWLLSRSDLRDALLSGRARFCRRKDAIPSPHGTRDRPDCPRACAPGQCRSVVPEFCPGQPRTTGIRFLRADDGALFVAASRLRRSRGDRAILRKAATAHRCGARCKSGGTRLDFATRTQEHFVHSLYPARSAPGETRRHALDELSDH
jgi:hypothetical protein